MSIETFKANSPINTLLRKQSKVMAKSSCSSAIKKVMTEKSRIILNVRLNSKVAPTPSEI